MVKNPRVYKNLVAEIDEADRHGALSRFVTYEQSLKLPYLYVSLGRVFPIKSVCLIVLGFSQAVMKEAMRIHSGVGFPLERYVPKGGANILGVQLKEGTIVSISASVVHADKEVYGEDADEFRPERWLEASLEQLKVMDRSFMAVSFCSITSGSCLALFGRRHYYLHIYGQCPWKPNEANQLRSSATVPVPVLERTFPSWRWESLCPRCSDITISNGRRRTKSGSWMRGGFGNSPVWS